MLTKKLASLFFVSLCLSSLTAQAKLLHNLPETLSIGEKVLKLNGAGVRKKIIFSVYVGGLYLATPSKDAAHVIEVDEAKAVSMHFLRDVNKKQLVESMSEGFEKNVNDKGAAQKANIDKLFNLLVDIKENEVLTFSYVPAVGVTVIKSGTSLGVINDKEFAKALFSIWFGSNPPSEDLKKGMLGM